MTGQKTRTLLLGLLILSLTTIAAAQITEPGGGSFDAAQSLINFANTITYFQVQSVAGVFLYIIAPIIGIYALTLNVMDMAYEEFEGKLGQRDRYSRDETDVPQTLKLFSLVIAFMTVQFLGAFSFTFLTLFGLIALVLGLAIQLNIIPFEKENSSSSSSSSSGSSGGGGSGNGSAGDSGDGGGQQVATDGGFFANLDGEKIGNAAAAAANADPDQVSESVQDIKEMKNEIAQVVDDLRGNPNDIGKAVGFLAYAVEFKQDSSKTIPEFFAAESRDLSEVLNDFEAVENGEERDQAAIEELGELVEEIEAEITKLENKIEGWENKSSQFNPYKFNFKSTEKSKTLNTFSKLERESKKVLDRSRVIEEGVVEEEVEITDELEKLYYYTKNMAYLYAFAKSLPGSPEEIANNDRKLKMLTKKLAENGLLSKFPHPSKNKIGPAGTEPSKKEWREAVRQGLVKMESNLAKLEKNLEKAVKRLKKELKIEKQQFNEIKQVIQPLVREDKEIEALISRLPNQNPQRYQFNEEDEEFFEKLQSKLMSIDSNLNQALTIFNNAEAKMGEEGEFLNESIRNLEKLMEEA